MWVKDKKNKKTTDILKRYIQLHDNNKLVVSATL